MKNQSYFVVEEEKALSVKDGLIKMKMTCKRTQVVAGNSVIQMIKVVAG